MHTKHSSWPSEEGECGCTGLGKSLIHALSARKLHSKVLGSHRQVSCWLLGNSESPASTAGVDLRWNRNCEYYSVQQKYRFGFCSSTWVGEGNPVWMLSTRERFKEQNQTRRRTHCSDINPAEGRSCRRGRIKEHELQAQKSNMRVANGHWNSIFRRPHLLGGRILNWPECQCALVAGCFSRRWDSPRETTGSKPSLTLEVGTGAGLAYYSIRQLELELINEFKIRGLG